MAMIVFILTKNVERSKIDLLKGVEDVDKLIDLYNVIADNRADNTSDAQRKINGFGLAQVLVFCMLIKNNGRKESLATALSSGKNFRTPL